MGYSKLAQQVKRDIELQEYKKLLKLKKRDNVGVRWNWILFWMAVALTAAWTWATLALVMEKV